MKHKTIRFFSASILLLLQIVVVPLSLSAQDNEEPPLLRVFNTQEYCQYVFDHVGSGSAMNLPGFEETRAMIEEKIRLAEQEVKIHPRTVHLVFHILYSDDTQEAQRVVKSQIEALNRDFSNKDWPSQHRNDPHGNYMNRASHGRIKFVSAKIHTVRNATQRWESWDDMKHENRGGSK